MRRPFLTPAVVSGDTATHAEYGVGPATDYGNLGAGATIVAPADCSIQQYQSSTGGDSLLLTGAGWQMNFQHLRSRGGNGRYAEGAKIAELAGWDDNHGSAWSGPHLHGWVVGPRSSIEEFFAARGFAAASIDEVASPTLKSLSGRGQPIRSEEDDMPQYVFTDQDGVGYALIDPSYVDGVIVTSDPSVADHFSWLAWTPDNQGAPVKLDRKAFNAKCAAATELWRKYRPAGAGGMSDAALEQLRAAIVGGLPTVEQFGAAARAAIVK